MGTINSKNSINAVNYDCEVCMKTGKDPNLAGRFFLSDNGLDCYCNGCGTQYPKTKFYKTVINE